MPNRDYWVTWAAAVLLLICISGYSFLRSLNADSRDDIAYLKSEKESPATRLVYQAIVVDKTGYEFHGLSQVLVALAGKHAVACWTTEPHVFEVNDKVDVYDLRYAESYGIHNDFYVVRPHGK